MANQCHSERNEESVLFKKNSYLNIYFPQKFRFFAFSAINCKQKYSKPKKSAWKTKKYKINSGHIRYYYNNIL